MGVVAGRAWRLLVHHMLLVQERPSLVVDEIALVVTLVAECIDLKRLRERVVDLIVALENRLVARPVRAARTCSGRRPLVVVVAIGAGDNRSDGVSRLEAAHGGIPAGGHHRMVRRIAGIYFDANISRVVLAQDPQRGLISNSVTLEANLVLVNRFVHGAPGNVDSLDAAQPTGGKWWRRGPGHRLVAVVTVRAGHVSRH